MLNRYGLIDIDIDKILREQGEAPPPGGAPSPGGEAPPSEAAPPTEEDPDEKVKASKDKAKDEDLAEFRKKHADAIYRLVQAYKHYRKAGEGQSSTTYPDPTVDERYSFNTQQQNLKSKFEHSGIDAPFIAILDQETTGLHGDLHIRLLTTIHGGRAGGRGRFMFQSPGAASEFAETAGDLRPDLTFEVQRGDPRVVSYTDQPEEPEAEQETGEQQPEQQAPPTPPGASAPPPGPGG